MYMYVRQSENVYSKVQIQAANLCGAQKETFMAMLNRDVQKRIFTNFKTVGHEIQSMLRSHAAKKLVYDSQTRQPNKILRFINVSGNDSEFT